MTAYLRADLLDQGVHKLYAQCMKDFRYLHDTVMPDMKWEIRQRINVGNTGTEGMAGGRRVQGADRAGGCHNLAMSFAFVLFVSPFFSLPFLPDYPALSRTMPARHDLHALQALCLISPPSDQPDD